MIGMWRLRFSSLRYKKFIKGGIVGYIQKIMIMVLLTLIVTFIISLFLNASFKTVLKFSTLAVLILGALSVVGGNNIANDYSYMLNKANSGMTSATKHDVFMRQGSYSFCIFMGISAGVLYIIYSLI